jgi:predicted  nucleic acid-binding Zn-ribbon protein
MTPRSTYLESLERKLVTLIRESERIYNMLEECLKSREQLQHQIEKLQEDMDALTRMTDEGGR